ncbi:2,3-bisphosphoglycerate-independent phosphoglycerate mutase [Mycena kentingensis (nom. inval.)]|nr:2,3-bisphosphoglycerate-independent phosphoglycerate mutase [Mycena kentingensis (nom. inval.)]
MKLSVAAFLVAALVATPVTPAPAPLANLKRQARLVRGATTLVLKEVGGVPGNECLTFRNNGEIVDAACVNEAADRQLTPSTFNGQNVLLVQRAFDAGFRPDLVGKDVCVGFNGTVFLAQDCATATQLVALQGDELRVSGSGQAVAKRELTGAAPVRRGGLQARQRGRGRGRGRGGRNRGGNATAAAAAAAGAGAAVGAGATAETGTAAAAAAADSPATNDDAAAASSLACQSGHDDLAQITVDPTGQTCATFTTTAVTPTDP